MAVRHIEGKICHTKLRHSMPLHIQNLWTTTARRIIASPQCVLPSLRVLRPRKCANVTLKWVEQHRQHGHPVVKVHIEEVGGKEHLMRGDSMLEDLVNRQVLITKQLKLSLR
jgi:hypothetical protein